MNDSKVTADKPRSVWRWVKRTILVLLALPVLLFALFVARMVWFPTRYDVVSIKTAPEYQSAELLNRAWALSAAKSYVARVDYQSNGSTCGPASLGNIFRSLRDAAESEQAVLDGADVCRTGICLGGLTLDDLAALARARSKHKVTVLRDLTLPAFRDHLALSNDPARRYLINFHRGQLFGQGHGHHSPLAGFLADQDLAFVLDVNAEFKPWLVKSERLFKAMDTVDSSTGAKRGLLLIE